MRHARGERGMIGLAAAVASVVIVAVIGGALLVHAYSDTVRNLTRKDSIGYLADISSQITENVRTVTSQIFSAMETIERGQMTLVENGATLDELNGEMAEDRDGTSPTPRSATPGRRTISTRRCLKANVPSRVSRPWTARMCSCFQFP